jgi:hypothetical protein
LDKLLGPQVLPDQQAMLDLQDQQAVPLAHVDLQVLPAVLVTLVLQALLVMLATLDLQASQVQQVPLAHMVQQDQSVPPDWVLLGSLAHAVPLVIRAMQEAKAVLGMRVHAVLRAHPAVSVSLVHRGIKVLLDPLV